MALAPLLRRMLWIAPTLLGVLVVVFVLLRVVPGDPIAMMVPGEATPADIAQMRERYGLDRSIAAQFAVYCAQVLRGDFGVSITMNQDVLGLVLGRLPATLELALVSLTLALAAGVS